MEGKVSPFQRFMNGGSSLIEHLLHRYMRNIIALIIASMFIVVSQIDSQKLYKEKEKLDREYESVLSRYNRMRLKYKSITLNSRIYDEVERRSIGIEQNRVPAIEIVVEE